MKRNVNPALKVVGISVFAVFLCFFVYISLFILVRQFSTQVVGYTVYEVVDGKSSDIETLTEPPETLTENQGYRQERTEMNAGASALLGTLQVICGLGVVFCFVGSVLAKEAAKDRNDADFNNIAADKLRGFKIGALAVIPLALINIATIVMKLKGLSAAIFYWLLRWGLLNPVKPVVDILTGNAVDIAQAPLWSLVALMGFTVLMVIFCGVMYIICYNEDSVISKLLYKSTKKKSKRKGW